MWSRELSWRKTFIARQLDGRSIVVEADILLLLILYYLSYLLLATKKFDDILGHNIISCNAHFSFNRRSNQMLKNSAAPSCDIFATMFTHNFRIAYIVFGNNADVMPNILPLPHTLILHRRLSSQCYHRGAVQFSTNHLRQACPFRNTNSSLGSLVW